MVAKWALEDLKNNLFEADYNLKKQELHRINKCQS